MSRDGGKKRRGVFERVKGAGIWSICYFDNRGRRHREVIGSKQDAIDAYEDRRGEAKKGRPFPKSVRAVRVAQLMEDLFADYKRDPTGSRWAHNAENYCWKLHLRPFFGNMRVADLSTDLLKQYVDERQTEKNDRGKSPSNATINRELATLRTALHRGRKSSPPKVFQVPPFPMQKEGNVRRGFLRDEQYDRLARECAKEGLWLRALIAVAYNFGWRRGELTSLQVRQTDLASRTIDLDPGTTKNDDARIVVMTQEVFELLRACIRGKKPDDRVFTRDDGTPVGDFRKVWQNVGVRAGLGRWSCWRCQKELSKPKCENCGRNTVRYSGLILHDFRRTSCRNMRRLGISEKTIMKVAGWKTRAVFDRYNIVDHEDIVDVARRLDENRKSRKTRPARVPRPSPNRATRVIYAQEKARGRKVPQKVPISGLRAIGLAESTIP